MRVPRTRGAVGGVLITLLGIWGLVIPFVGPYFHYSIGPDTTWHWTTGRLWLSVLPGAVAIVGGLILLGSRSRPVASFGALLGVAAGAWFVGGSTVSQLWNHGVSQAGALNGARGTRVLEELGFHLALGAFILYFAAAALGRLSIRSVRDVELAEAESTAVVRGEPLAATAPVAREEDRTAVLHHDGAARADAAEQPTAVRRDSDDGDADAPTVVHRDGVAGSEAETRQQQAPVRDPASPAEQG